MKITRSCLFIIVIILLIWNYRLYVEFPETTIISSIDGEQYTVKKNYDNAETAADILAKLNEINETLITHLEKKYARSEKFRDIRFLSNNYDGDVMAEHTPRTHVNTSYVLNKGDAIRLCLRDKVNGKFHDFNTILFVNFHEISHLLDRKWGHTASFWRGFKFLLHEAHEIGVYNPVDYSKTPASYCGIKITSNPFFNQY